MSKLTREQAAKVRESVGRSLNYLGRLRERMERVGFTPTDQLYQLVFAAWNAVYALSVELHYQSCQGGVGK